MHPPRIDARLTRSYAPPVNRHLIALFLSGALAGAASAAPRVTVVAGERDVEVHALQGRATYVRVVHVYGATRRAIVASLVGPATGPDGFAPNMVSETPVARQHSGRFTRAEKTRLPGLPAALGATVSAEFTGDGVLLKMRDGMTFGDFRIDVSPERRLPDGGLEVRVTESGWFTMLNAKPRSLLGVPLYIIANKTPMGWFMQAAGGAAVSKAHIALFELEAVLAKRLGARAE